MCWDFGDDFNQNLDDVTFKLLLLVTTSRLQEFPCVFMLLYLIGLRLSAITDDQFGAPIPYIPLCVAISRRFQIALFH